jgi:hypothetical protein
LLRILEFPGQLTRLLGHPGPIGMSGAAREMDASCPKLDKKQDIQGAQAEGFDRQKITSQHLLFVMVQEGAPIASPPLWSRWNTMPFENVVVVAKYVMVDENLPHDRRNYQVLVSIMRQ